MWTKTRVSSESHTTHVNPNFEGNVHIHSPDVIVERVRGSAAFAKLFSDSAVAYVDKDDQHSATSSTQKRLSAGFALISKLAVGLVVGASTGGFGLTGVQASMVNAGFGSLCGDAAVSLVENGGDPARAIQAMGRNGTALNIARAMATAGLVDGISSAAGVKTGFETGVDGKLIERTFTDYASRAAIQSAVNTVLAVGIDRQDFKQALLQGMASAAVNTAASFGAGQIGGMYRINAIDPVVHKALHAALGATSSAATAAMFGSDIRLAALSGATGAFVAETVAEMVKPDVATESAAASSRYLTKQEFQEQFMEKAQASAQWANFAAAVTAFGTGLDAGVAYGAAYNATAHNFLHAALVVASVAGTAYEGYQIYQTYEKEGGEAALRHLGISVVEGAAVAGAVGVAFKVGKVVYPTLKDAFKAIVANNMVLKASLSSLETKLGTVEQAIRQKFSAGGIEAFKPATKVDASVRPLLPGETRVGTFRELDLMGKKGDHLTPNHMPQAAFMGTHGVKRPDGIAMMMEQPVPGTGGRHRATRTYGRQPDLTAAPRQELARDLVDARAIYKADGVYTPEVRSALLEVAERNKQAFPELFRRVTE